MTTVNLEDVFYTRSDDGVDYRDIGSLTGDDILRKIFPNEKYAYNFYQKLGRHKKHYNRVDRKRPISQRQGPTVRQGYAYTLTGAITCGG
ncbi:hypothetical protein AHAS_Ahas01G0291800 [Arachis hypogaea]